MLVILTYLCFPFHDLAAWLGSTSAVQYLGEASLSGLRADYTSIKVSDFKLLLDPLDIYIMSYGQFQVSSAPQPVRPVSPRCPSNGWINNGGWIGKSFSFRSLLFTDPFPDGGINPPHFYLTHEECQQALYYHTGMAEHP